MTDPENITMKIKSVCVKYIIYYSTMYNLILICFLILQIINRLLLKIRIIFKCVFAHVAAFPELYFIFAESSFLIGQNRIVLPNPVVNIFSKFFTEENCTRYIIHIRIHKYTNMTGIILIVVFHVTFQKEFFLLS